ncbi:uncharacterized protein LOC128672081 [Plodia interpunctella]|uniref:uncharacterized protein LOC128672081 n=1 Tax=Plodia interpunctella TaxID=58824 RepID=UPI0023678791|nr:uncharacterized protein LOC128672081 [Plodia interpunctella]
MRSFQCVIIMYIHQLCGAKDTLPLFILDYDNNLGELMVDTNPFATISSAIFGEIVEDAVKHCSVIIIFVEDQFCTEDVSGKDKLGTPYVNLRTALLQNKVKYLPNVVNPLSVLFRFMPPAESNAFVLRSGEPIQIPEGLPFYYIYFNDYDGSRVETLRRHDVIMHDIFEETRIISSTALGIYTGRHNPIVLAKYGRGGQSTLKNQMYMPQRGVYLASEGALFHFVGLSIEMATHKRRAEFKDVPNVASELRSVTSPDTEHLRTNIEYQGLQIKFSFRLSEEFWTLDNVTLIDGGEDMGTTVLGVNVPIGRSYYCNEPLIIVNENDKSYVRIPEYQVQPFRARARRVPEDVVPFQGPPPPGPMNPSNPAWIAQAVANSSNTNFSSATKCNPYFNVRILTGLVVTGVCLSILFVGISVLYNCSGNDHFDDPLAKQLVIAASE